MVIHTGITEKAFTVFVLNTWRCRALSREERGKKKHGKYFLEQQEWLEELTVAVIAAIEKSATYSKLFNGKEKNQRQIATHTV